MIFIIGALLSVILFTSLLGRVWCGWACPQTVYMEFLFRPIERWLEGSEHVRKRRNEGPYTLDRIWRKSIKLGIFLAISLILAHTFVAYFVGWEALLVWIQSPPATNWGFFLMMAITTGLILFDFGYFREQMCTIACPYARMQSVLLDPDSMIVSYDPTRGEPRGKRSRKRLDDEAAGLETLMGDCIDCLACVRTCPTGIDIREGLQMECIACTQCIDACDAIMDRIEKPRGLIRYTSERDLSGSRTSYVRPRTIVYSVLLVGILTAFTTVLTARDAYDVDVGRVAGDPFAVLPDGRIANRLRFRVRNQTADRVSFDLSARTPEGAQIQAVGALPVSLDPGEMKRVESWVIVPAEAFHSDALEGIFELEFSDGERVEAQFVLLGPTN
jgi:cytochrome c oxidase accessory protein FixG